MIRVSNQLVAAPISSDVIVECYVEASPRAMNHWMRDTGNHQSQRVGLVASVPYVQAPTHIYNSEQIGTHTPVNRKLSVYFQIAHYSACPNALALSYITLNLIHINTKSYFI